MEAHAYNQLQIREVFHLEFLRWFARKAKTQNYVLKGGVNLRFFFRSFRYSEDMDLDAHGVRKDVLWDVVMGILEAASFCDTLKPFGIQKIIPPDITKAKQTETTQRFKIHLMTFSGEDLFTKIEFSKRGFEEGVRVEPVLDSVLREYKMPPLLIPHYTIEAAISQKIYALQARRITQARDIFDLYILSSQYQPDKGKIERVGHSAVRQIEERIFAMGFSIFRDTVVSYLSSSDRGAYERPETWDEIRLKAVHFVKELDEKGG